MKIFKTTLITCFSIYAVIAIAFLLFGDREKLVMVGLSGLLLSIAYLFLGIILWYPGGKQRSGKRSAVVGRYYAYYRAECMYTQSNEF